MAEHDDRYVAAIAEAYEEQVDAIAEKLRRMADDVERRRTPRKSLDTLRPDYIGGAAEAVHDLIWGFANLHADALVSCAKRVEDATRAASLAPEGGTPT